jgi:poly(A) polymerase
MRFKDVPQMKESTLKRFLRVEKFGEHLELHRLDCLSSHGHLEHYEQLRQKWAQMPASELKPQPLITGQDLIAAGYQPGPAFARILAAVEDEQLESRIRTREEAMALVRAKFRAPHGGLLE